MAEERERGQVRLSAPAWLEPWEAGLKREEQPPWGAERFFHTGRNCSRHPRRNQDR